MLWTRPEKTSVINSPFENGAYRNDELVVYFADIQRRHFHFLVNQLQNQCLIATSGSRENQSLDCVKFSRDVLASERLNEYVEVSVNKRENAFRC